MGLAALEMWHVTEPENGVSINENGLDEGKRSGVRWFSNEASIGKGMPEKKSLALQFKVDSDLPVRDVPEAVKLRAANYANQAAARSGSNPRAWGGAFNDYLCKWIDEEGGNAIYRHQYYESKSGTYVTHYALNKQSWKQLKSIELSGVRPLLSTAANAAKVVARVIGVLRVGILSASGALAVDAMATSPHYREAIRAAQAGDEKAFDSAVYGLTQDMAIASGSTVPFVGYGAYQYSKPTEPVKLPANKNLWQLLKQGVSEVGDQLKGKSQ